MWGKADTEVELPSFPHSLYWALSYTSANPHHPDPEPSSSSCHTLVTKPRCLLCPSQSPRS